LHIESDEDLNIRFNSSAQQSELHFQANGIESVIGQYDLTTSKMLLDGTLPAKGLSYFQGNFETISSDQTEGMLLNVDNDKPLYFANAGKERMRIHDDGKMHVGGYDSEFPKALNVKGSTRITDTLFFNDPDFYINENEDTLNVISDKHIKFKTNFIGDFSFNNRDSTFVHFDGSRKSVGIGIQNAVQELEVNGDMLVYDTIYVGNRFTKLYTGANTYFSALTNMRLETRANYDIEILSDRDEYATFDAENKRFGVGTTTPEEKIDVDGTVKANLFKMTTSPGAGKVMTSNADGLASWEDIPNDNDWSKVGSDLYTSTGGTVTIGTSGLPSSKLNVKGSISLPIVKLSLASYTPTANDHTVIMDMPSASITLPSALSSDGRIYVLKFRSPGANIQASGSDTIEGGPTFSVPTSYIASAFSTIVVQSDGLNGWWIINY
jgi:hypothetical protein